VDFCIWLPPAFSRTATAQTYPTRPVRWIVGYPPAGATDIAARLIGQWLSDRLGQAFVTSDLQQGRKSTNICVSLGVIRGNPVQTARPFGPRQ
jgi:hypothetical protein